MHNTRRHFIKVGFTLGAAFSLDTLSGLFAEGTNDKPEKSSNSGSRPTLAALRDGSRTAMLDKGLEALGGIGAFVKAGQTVVIKPNIGWDVSPEGGANTHPEIVGHLVKLCLAAGAKSVSVFDNTCDQWQKAYEHSGIEKAARDAGARVVSGKDERLYREVAIPNGIKLKSAKVHQLVLDSDVFFNVPVLKHHSGSLMTASMKNLMGVVWDRGFYHNNDLHQTIADFLTFKKPALNILDAYHPMMRNGPRGTSPDDCVEMRAMLISTDPVLVDAAAAKMMGHEVDKVTHVKLAAQMKIGSSDLEHADIRRFKLA
jgi:uncharacterized protein (DUF362 family)